MKRRKEIELNHVKDDILNVYYTAVVPSTKVVFCNCILCLFAVQVTKVVITYKLFLFCSFHLQKLHTCYDSTHTK